MGSATETRNSWHFFIIFDIMTSTAIRQRLITYLSDAEDNKIRAIYTLLEREIEDEQSFNLSEEHLDILDRER